MAKYYDMKKTKKILSDYKFMDGREDSAAIVEAFSAAEVEDNSTDEAVAKAIAENDLKWSKKFTDQFFSGTATPGTGAPEEPLPETAPRDEILENSGNQYTYENLFTEVKE